MGKPRWVPVLLIVILLASFYAASTESHVHVTSSTDNWPMFRHDLAHTGQSTGTALTSDVVKIWNYTTGNGLFKAVYSSPSVVDGVVYVGSDDGFVYALDAFTGVQIWNYSTGRAVSSSPVVASGVVYISSYPNVYALSASSGTKLWNYTTVGGRSSPAVVNGFVYVGSSGLYCLDASAGAKIWYTDMYRGVASSPAVASGYVYVGAMDGNLNCVSASNGTIIWKYDVGGRDTISSPAIAYKMIYIGSGEPYDGNVYCLGTPSVTAAPSPSVNPPAGSIVVPDDFSTIQEAVDNAPIGGAVFVRNGVYVELVTIGKPLSLIGEDGKNTIIVGVFPLSSLWTWPVIKVVADDVTISGFTIKNAPDGILITGRPSRCKISGNNIVDNFRHGIGIETSENHVISGNNITGNKGDGIVVSSSNNIISGNNITRNGESGITCYQSENVTIRHNIISNNYNGGLSLRWGGPFYVYENNITDNQVYGIQFGLGCNNSSIYQNNIMRNSIGVELYSHALSVTGSFGSENIVYQNNFADNSQQAVVDIDEYYENKTQGDSADVVSWDNSTVGNYWNDYQTRYPYAAEVDTSGIGDTPYIIDENNTDNHPLIGPVTISLTPPPISEPSSDSLPMIAAFVAVAVTVFVVVFFVYRAHRKGSKQR